MKRIPLPALHGLHTTLINSQYTNMVSYLKNCYMVTHADNNENCSYGSMIDNSKDSLDNLMIYKCELTYGSVNCRRCYLTFFSVDCEDSHNIYFSKNCVGCSNCFGCTNLRNKQYHIFNKPHTKEEYAKFLEENYPDSFTNLEKLQDQAFAHWSKFPRKYMHERHNSNVSGDYIYNSKNTFNSFIATDAEDCRYISFITPGGIKDAYDFTNYGTTSELLYETLQSGDQAARIFFSWWVVTNCQGIEYSMFCVGSQNIFGSIGLKKRQYCILNKQYSQEEFEKLRAQIIKDMNRNPYVDVSGNTYKYGEFFPIELSPFPYNDSFAQETLPLAKEDAVKRGYSWHGREARNYQISLKNDQVPGSIKDVQDSILNEIIGCQHQSTCNENCTEAFRIISQELDFLRKHNLPLPRLCPNCRHYQRIKQRNPLKLWHRKCGCAGAKSENKVYQNTADHMHHKKEEPCLNEFETTYAPERPEIVYCEQCYLREVV